MVWVRPGVLLVFAILSATSELIRLDLPTLDRPKKAISGALGAGNCLGSAADVTKRVRTFMLQLWRRRAQSASRPSQWQSPASSGTCQKVEARAWRASERNV